MNEMSGGFCYRNRKNRSTPLFKGQIYLNRFLIPDEKDFYEGLNFGRVLRT